MKTLTEQLNESLNESKINKTWLQGIDMLLNKSLSNWKSEAERLGFKVIKPSVTIPDGEINKDSFFVAQDSKGNERGQWFIEDSKK